MPDRTRPIRKEICLNKLELNLVQHKMRQLGTHNFGAYARKMLIDGYIIKVDYTEQKKLAAAVSRVAVFAQVFFDLDVKIGVAQPDFVADGGTEQVIVFLT